MVKEKNKKKQANFDSERSDDLEKDFEMVRINMRRWWSEARYIGKKRYASEHERKKDVWIALRLINWLERLYE